jgi:hypothetical protein
MKKMLSQIPFLLLRAWLMLLSLLGLEMLWQNDPPEYFF